jgi:hypothetical protein
VAGGMAPEKFSDRLNGATRTLGVSLHESRISPRGERAAISHQALHMSLVVGRILPMLSVEVPCVAIGMTSVQRLWPLLRAQGVASGVQ